MRSSGESLRPMTPLPFGPSLNSCPAFELPGISVWNSDGAFERVCAKAEFDGVVLLASEKEHLRPLRDW